MTFIRHLEAGDGGYDAYERRITVPPPKKLTAMRLGEVLAWQRRVRAAGNPSSAAGGYQIIHPTLVRLTGRLGIDPGARFGPALQDRLARALIAECGHKGPPERHGRYGNCLARIWAALPLTAGPQKGRSAWRGVAGNRALARPETVLALIAGKPVPLRRGPAAGPPVRAEGGPAFRVIEATPDTPPPATRAQITDAMHEAQRAGSLTPSVRTWKLDPYALD